MTQSEVVSASSGKAKKKLVKAKVEGGKVVWLSGFQVLAKHTSGSFEFDVEFAFDDEEGAVPFSCGPLSRIPCGMTPPEGLGLEGARHGLLPAPG